MTIQYLVVSRTNIISSSKHQFRVPCNVSLYVNLGADFMRFTISILTLSRKRPGYCLTRFNCNLLQIMRESYIKKKKKEFRPGANEIFVMLIANSNYTINQTISFFYLVCNVCVLYKYEHSRINENVSFLCVSFLYFFLIFFFFWTRINRARINSNRSAICHVDVSRQQNSTIPQFA